MRVHSPSIAVPVSLAACHAVWRRARRGKRPSSNQLAFEARWLDRLLDLKTVLRAGSWQPRRTVSFIVSHPKTREIHAPDFADRVVHHLLVQQLEKIYEPVFIHDSYVNRTGKGSHAAVDRLEHFVRQHNGVGWYLQLDIHNFFNTIYRLTLYAMLCKRLEKCNLQPNHALALRSLCHKLLANKVTEQVRDADAAARLPTHKRLANAPPGCGVRPRAVQHCKANQTAWAAHHVKQAEQGITIHASSAALAHLQSMLGSYWSHFAPAHSVRLRRALVELFVWLNALSILSPAGALQARWVLQGETFAAQAAGLQAQWPTALCQIQKGYQLLELPPQQPTIPGNGAQPARCAPCKPVGCTTAPAAARLHIGLFHIPPFQ